MGRSRMLYRYSVFLYGNADIAGKNQFPHGCIEKFDADGVSIFGIADDDTSAFFDGINRRIVRKQEKKNIGLGIKFYLHFSTSE